jgi:uncharacterized protein (TIGR03067 family)
MNCCMAIALAVSLFAAADMPKEEQAFQGTWKLMQWDVFGKSMDKAELKDCKLVIKGDRYSLTLNGQTPTTGTQRVNPNKNPKTIDIIDTSGQYAGKMCHGIYEINGDEFRVIFSPPGQPRPKHFKVLHEGQWMHVWKHVKQ